ncbi:hypothetical protein D3C80_986310 [compost metagenome]
MRQDRVSGQLVKDFVCRADDVWQEQRSPRAVSGLGALRTGGDEIRIFPACGRAGAIGRQNDAAECDTRRAGMRPFLLETVDQRCLRSQEIVRAFTADDIAGEKVEAGLSRPASRILGTTTVPESIGKPWCERAQAGRLGTRRIAGEQLVGERQRLKRASQFFCASMSVIGLRCVIGVVCDQIAERRCTDRYTDIQASARKDVYRPQVLGETKRIFITELDDCGTEPDCFCALGGGSEKSRGRGDAALQMALSHQCAGIT